MKKANVHFVNIPNPRENPKKIENFLFENISVFNNKYKLKDTMATNGTSIINTFEIVPIIGNDTTIIAANIPV